jgi:hypothetical protein
MILACEAFIAALRPMPPSSGPARLGELEPVLISELDVFSDGRLSTISEP